MRDIAEIEADLTEVEGVKGQGNKIGKLRKELVAAQREKIADLENQKELLASSESFGAVTAEVPVSPAGTWDTATPGPLESDEWAFVQQACAELKPPQAGSSTGLVKWAFNDMDARVKNWRIARALITKLGVGAAWPQFTALGLCHRTGRPLHEHSVLSDDWIPDYEEPKPEPDSRESEHKGPVEPVYEMPENAAPANQPNPGAMGGSATDADAEAEKVRALVGAQIDAKGDPVLE